MLSLQHIKTELWQNYGDRKRKLPHDDIAEVQDLTLQMLGGRPSSQAQHTKAAETKGLVVFAVDLLKSKRARFTGPDVGFLIGAGEALQDYFDLIGDAPRNVPAPTLQRMYDAIKKHLVLSQRAGVPMKPKHHLVIHLVARTAKHGNPSYYATFTDEGINKLLKKVGHAVFGKVEEARSCRKRALPV